MEGAQELRSIARLRAPTRMSERPLRVMGSTLLDECERSNCQERRSALHVQKASSLYDDTQGPSRYLDRACASFYKSCGERGGRDGQVTRDFAAQWRWQSRSLGAV